MTYREIVDDLIDILKRHKMIKSWGYGTLTDLVAPFEKADATKSTNAPMTYDRDYPYAFLQPQNHLLTKNKSTYRFNLIMMEMCDVDPQSVINAQSDCHQYIKDVLAEIYYSMDQKYDFNLNVSIIPFKELYDDVVSGMTAQIELEVPDPLNACIAPFEPYVEGDLQIWVGHAPQQTLGEDPGEDNVITASTYQINPSPYGNWDVNKFYNNSTRTWKVELTALIKIAPGTGTTIPTAITLREATGAVDNYADIVTGYPTDINADWQQLTMIWNAVELNYPNTLSLFRLAATPGTDANIQLKDVQIKMWS